MCGRRDTAPVTEMSRTRMPAITDSTTDSITRETLLLQSQQGGSAVVDLLSDLGMLTHLCSDAPVSEGQSNT